MNNHPLYSRLLAIFAILCLIGHVFAQEPCNLTPPAKLPLQLGQLAEPHPIDKCACTGAPKGESGSDIFKANNRQNEFKNNFMGNVSSPKWITVADMIRLQEAVDAIPFNQLPRGDRFHLPSPEQRKRLASLKIGGGKTFGEGEVVLLAGFVIGSRHSNVDSGESVNCEETGCANNDIHIEVTPSPLEVGEDKDDKMNEEGVDAEISPRHRPVAWETFDSPDYVNTFRTHPVMFAGQLFYDASHSPGGGPSRASVWEVHPVYAIWVCKLTTLAKCTAAPPNDAAVWVPFHKLKGFLGLQTVRKTKKCKNSP